MSVVKTRKAAAAKLGITEKALGNWKNEPDFPDCSQGYDLDQIRAWRNERDRKGSATTTRAAALREKAQAAKVKKTILECEALERKAEIEKGNLLPRDELELGLSEIITLTRDQLLSMPKRVARGVPRNQRQKVIEVLEREIGKSLNAFADMIEQVRKDSQPDT